MEETKHLVGLLLGTEEDWPTAFETLVSKLGPIKDASGATHRVTTERITMEPFDLRDKPRYDLVVDRLAYWYYLPREWLKKVALMDDVYLLNSPFTFQAMEKHAAYCAMLRLGLKVPQTVLVPHKNPPDNARFAYTAAKYNRPFDLDEIAEGIGYPLFMKPYDGGQWIGVSHISDSRELHRAYDESGQRLMHLQAAVDGFDVFARSLSIGAETMVMHFRPDQPMHDRYAVDHDFLSHEVGEEVLTISRLINAFFRWEFNSCETLVRGTEAHPIDYANASPDVAVTSLHYYFPWAMSALLKWCAFCVVTGREPRMDLDTRRYFEIGDREDLSYAEKLAAYRELADAYFEVDRYRDFCDSRLGARRRAGARLDQLGRLRPAARPDRPLDVPGARARALPRRTSAAWSASGSPSAARRRRCRSDSGGAQRGARGVGVEVGAVDRRAGLLAPAVVERPGVHAVEAERLDQLEHPALGGLVVAGDGQRDPGRVARRAAELEQVPRLDGVERLDDRRVREVACDPAAGGRAALDVGDLAVAAGVVVAGVDDELAGELAGGQVGHGLERDRDDHEVGVARRRRRLGGGRARLPRQTLAATAGRASSRPPRRGRARSAGA